MHSEIHVAIVSRYPPRGITHSGRGIAGYTKNLARELVAAGTRVTVVAPVENGVRERYTEDGVEVDRTWHLGPRSYSRILASLSMLRPDVVHIQHELFALGSRHWALVPPLLARRVRSIAPVVTTIHGVIPRDDFTDQFVRDYVRGLPGFAVRQVYSSVMSGLVAASDAIVVHEDSVGRALRSYAPGADWFTVAHGVEPRPEPVQRRDALRRFGLDARPRALFFGFLLPYKGVDLLEKAAPLLKSHDIEVLIAGGHHADGLIKQSSSNGGSTVIPNVRRMGYVEEYDIPALFAVADVLVLPYRIGLAASGPLTIAAANRTAVVVSDVATLRDILACPAATFPRGDVEGLAAAVIRVIGDSRIRQQVLTRIEELADLCSWDAVAAETVTVYEKLLRVRR